MFIVVIIWAAIVTTLVSKTEVRENCKKKGECTIVVRDIGISIERKE